MTTSRSRGISTSMFLRLCPRAPRMTMLPAMSTLASALAADLLARRGDGALEDGAVVGEMLAGVGFEAHDQRGLRVRRPQQTPAVLETHARTVEIDQIVAGGAQSVAHPVGDAELELVGTVDPDLRRGRGGRQVGQQVAHGLAAAA